ncbi:MAG: cytochrome c [Alphaproteobacteria bacterium]|jgi:cytochrome c556
MKSLTLLAAASVLSLLASHATAQDDPFADIVETRHGLMLQMAADMAKMGAMVKGAQPFDAAVSGRAAANVAAIASVLSMDQWPAGSENGKATDSFSKADIWTATPDFLTKIADINAATAALVPLAATDVDSLKTGMAGVGKACGACHTAYRMAEN